LHAVHEVTEAIERALGVAATVALGVCGNESQANRKSGTHCVARGVLACVSVARLFLRRQPRPPCLLPEPGGGLLCFCFFSTRQEGLGILRQQERKKADSKSNTTHSLSHKTHSHITNKVQTGLTRKSHKKCLNILKKSPAEPKSPCVPHFLLASKNLSLTFFSLLVCSLAAPHVSVAFSWQLPALQAVR